MKTHLPILPGLRRSFGRLLLLAIIAVFGSVNAQVTTFPWTETFNSGSPTLSQWTQIHESGEMDWTFTNDASTGSYTLPPYEGNFANFPADSWDGETTKLVSPVLNLTGLSNVTLNFYYVNPQWDTENNILTVYYRTSSSGAWTALTSYSTDVDPWTPSGAISLPNPSATYQIALECHTFYAYSTLVDQVVVSGTAGAVTVESVDVATQGGVPAQITTAGGTLQLSATVNPTGANQAVTWSVVSGSGFGSVNASGLVTAAANGSVTVRATSVADPTKFDDIVITVNVPPAVASVEITTAGNVPAEITTEGGTLQLEATVNPSGASQDVTWSVVAGGSFASVSASGVVTAVADGIATIQATSVADPTKFDIIDVVINTVIPVESVVITTAGGVDAIITTTGGTLQLEAAVNPQDADQEVTWTVTAGAEFGSVSASGVVNAIADGIITVQATSVADPTKYDIIDVLIDTVIAVESVEVSTENDVPATISTEGGTLQLVAVVNPEGAEQEVTWSIVSGSELATLSAEGLVTANANGTVTVRATSVGDETKFDDIIITISGILGTGDFNFNNLNAYPNPVTDILHISSAESIKTVELYNMLGQQLVAKTIDGEQSQIDMGSFASGNYILKINTENASKTMKIVKQ